MDPVFEDKKSLKDMADHVSVVYSSKLSNRNSGLKGHLNIYLNNNRITANKHQPVCKDETCDNDFSLKLLSRCETRCRPCKVCDEKKEKCVKIAELTQTNLTGELYEKRKSTIC